MPKTLDFLEAPRTNVDDLPIIRIHAAVVGAPDVTGPIEFQRKAGSRMRIARQNRRSPHSQRHPAWTAARGFPLAPDDIGSMEDARPYFPDGGLRIYIAKTLDGDFLAGFTKGHRPADMNRVDPMWDLFPTSIRNPVGGVIDAN